MYDPDEIPDVRRNRRWVRLLAALVAAALIIPSALALRSFLSAARDEPAPVDPERGPAYRPAATIACGTTAAPEPVDGTGDADRVLAAIQQRVEDLRKLRFERPVEAQFRSPEEVEQDIGELSLDAYEPEEIDRDERILRTLGMLPDDQGLPEIIEGLAAQVAGFYDPRAGELVVASDRRNEELSPLDEVILAHELEHALADQTFGLPVDDDPAGTELDSELAARSLIEGDATLLSQHYAATGLTPEDAAAMMNDPSLQTAADDMADIPYPIQRGFEFPYVQGLAFACELYSSGGWEAVDDAYENLPTTTAQILFPHRYRTGEGAEQPDEVGDPGRGWEEIDDAAVGAADLLLMFQAPGGDPSRALHDPQGRAGAWAGGTMKVFAKGGDTALGVSLLERRAGDGLCSSIHAWTLKSFPPVEQPERQPGEVLVVVEEGGRTVVLNCEGREVRFGIAPEVDVARDLTGS